MQSSRRRLGRLRRGQQLGDPQPRAVRRSQRRCSIPPARTSRAGCWRRSAGAGSTALDPADASAASRYLLETQESGRKLVRALGRELHLYGTLPRARGLRAAGDQQRLDGHMEGRALDRARCRTLTAGWGESCASYGEGRFVAGAEHAVPDRVGAAGPDGGRAGRRARSPGAARGYLVDTQQRRRDLGRDARHRHGLSRRLLSPLHALPEVFPAAAPSPTSGDALDGAARSLRLVREGGAVPRALSAGPSRAG